MWVSNAGSNSVSEIQASTGAVINTIPVGSKPEGIYSDGTDVWVTNSASNNVSEIQISSGTVVRTISVGGNPCGVFSDGTDVWVTNFYSDSVSEILVSTGAVIRNISVGSHPDDVTSDGTNLWVANAYSNSVSEIQASTGTVLQTISVGNYPLKISSDGENVWVTNNGSNTVSEIQASSGSVIRVIPVGNYPRGISADGSNVWVSNQHSNSVTKISPHDAPAAPTASGSAPNDGQTATFSWSPGSDGGSAISGYSIQTSTDGTSWTTTTVGSGVTSFTSNLGSNPNFYFQVAAINVFGVGAYSSAVVISRTVADQPDPNLTQTGNHATLTWPTPFDGGAVITGYSIKVSSDNVHWIVTVLSAGILSYTGTLLPGQASFYQVAAINSIGTSAYSDVQSALGPGLAPQLVQVLTANGQSVSGGLVTWTAGNVVSSVNYGLTSDGKILFPSAPSGSVQVTVTNAVMPDGSYVSGTFTTTFGYPVNTVTLPPEPSSAATTVTVEAPDGATLPGAAVSIPNNAVNQTVYAYDGTTTFTAPQVIGSGTTDASGSVVLTGFIDPGTTLNAVYNDGVITQTVTSMITSSSVVATLPYGPVTLYPIVPNAAVTAGSLVSVTLATSSVSPNFRVGVNAKFIGATPRVSAGLPVRAVLPAGYKSCRGQVLTGTTNSQGNVTLKFCAAKTALVKFVAGGAGAYVSRMFQVYVKGTVPTAVLGTLASTPQLGHASLSWTAPAFNGGSPITKYVVTLSAAGKRTVIVNATSTHVNVGGLADATRYSVSIVAVNKTGKSPAAVSKVSVA